MTWNVAGATERDIARVVAERIDVAVLCEADREPPASSQLPLWSPTGEVPHQSLVVAGLTLHGQAVEAHPGEGQLSMAVDMDNGLGILGVWNQEVDGSSYGAELKRALDDYERRLTSRVCLIAGDFNVDPGGVEDTRTGVLKDTFERLNALGYHSGYYHDSGTEYDRESHPTDFRQRHRGQPFHLDFVFLHEALLDKVQEFRVGTYDERAPEAAGKHSDHAPIIVELDL